MGINVDSFSEAWTVTQIREDRNSANSTVDVYAAKILPKDANTLIRRLNSCMPLNSLGHVKRVRRKTGEDGVELSIILCLVPDTDSEQSTFMMPPVVNQIVEEYDLKSFIVAVPQNEACSREEWEGQSHIWPTSYHPNAVIAHRMMVTFTDEEVNKICRFMKVAIKQAQLAAKVGQFANGAVIVDPSTDRIVSSSHDETGRWMPASFQVENRQRNICGDGQIPNWHPLRHAVMVAIERAAETNKRERYEINPSYTRESKKRPRVIERNEVVEDSGKLNDRYLCTGFDVYITREPCAMCAMALLHQRVHRVFYGISNPQVGALGGSLKLHEKKGLNHHYLVFQVSLNEQDVL